MRAKPAVKSMFPPKFHRLLAEDDAKLAAAATSGVAGVGKAAV